MPRKAEAPTGRMSFADVKRSRPPGGWKNAPEDGDHMLFDRAYVVSRLCCLNHKSVYDWAVKEGNDLKSIYKQLGGGPVLDNPVFWPLFDAVVSGLPFTPLK